VKFILQKCRKTIYWAILFAGIGPMIAPTANALVIGDINLGILCGPINTTPLPIPVGSSYKFLTASTTTTVLKAGTADRKQLRHFVVIKMVNPNGTVAWTRSLVTQSLAVAEVDLDDTPPSYSVSDVVDGDRPGTPGFFLPFECLSLGVATSGNKRYITVSLGTTSSTGGTDPVVAANKSMNPGLMASSPSQPLGVIKGQDKTVLNISILNINNGNVVRSFRPRPKPNRFFLVTSSGIVDIDNDFNDELVLVYIKFIGETRNDLIFEHYNIVTGALERTTTTTQQNKVIFQK